MLNVIPNILIKIALSIFFPNPQNIYIVINANNLLAMVKRIVSIALSNDVVESLDQTTKALGMSRSEYIEMMIKKGFHFSDEVQNTVSKISQLQEQVKDSLVKEEGKL